MHSGVVSHFIGDKGFGFVQDSDDGHAYFFHEGSLVRGSCAGPPTVSVGQAVNFDLEEGPRGPVAVRINRFGDLELHGEVELETSEDSLVVEAFRECTRELSAYLAKNPTALYDLHPGAFESLVAAIFEHEGFTVDRIGAWNQPDGGIDLLAVRRLGPEDSIRLAVQCKRWNRSKRVDAGPVRSLAGVLDRFQAHKGVLATTGLFSGPAREEVASHFWRISLRDFDSIVASLKRYEFLGKSVNPATPDGPTPPLRGSDGR